MFRSLGNSLRAGQMQRLANARSLTTVARRNPLPAARFVAPTLRQPMRRFCAEAPKKRKPTTEKPFAEQWLSEPGTYPIIVIIAAACGLCAYKLIHDLYDPDVSISRRSRNKVSWLEDEDDVDIRKRRLERGQKLSDRRGHHSSIKEED
eukprot:g1649.t1